MKKISAIIVFLLTASYGCKVDDSKLWYEIRESRSVDQAQRYLLDHPNTKHFSEIIDSLRFFWREDPRSWGGDYIDFKIDLKTSGSIYVENNSSCIDSLYDQVLEFYTNPHQNPEYSWTTPLDIEGYEDLFKYIGVIVIRSDPGYNLKDYKSIISTIYSVVGDIRNDWSNHLFSKEYISIELDEKEVIEAICPLNIWFETYIPGPNENPPLGTPIII